MPARLRPTASPAADAILVGDPGRALMLAQELLEQPKMSNHARGLWGYTGRTAGGHELTVQSTGMGGPSAALVLADLAKLGVRRAVRVGTCASLSDRLGLGQLLEVSEAHAWGGPGAREGASVVPNADLAARLRARLGDAARSGTAASLDTPHGEGVAAEVARADVADMQTAALFDRGAALGVAIAAVLVVTETRDGEVVDDEGAERAAKLAGTAAAAALSP